MTVYSSSELEQLEAKIKSTTESFLNGFRGAVEDLSALEVNTMIVSEINGLKFDPENAYRALFVLLESVNESDAGNTRSIKGEFENNTLKKLKQNLIGAVQNALEAPDEDDVSGIIQNQASATIPTNFQLPRPGTSEAKQLLRNKRFMRTLRKLNELRSLVDKPRFNDTHNIYDNIYAQTIIQLDGDVMNYFHRRLFESDHDTEQRDLLLKIHKEAVEGGQKNWQDILHLIFDMLSQIPKIFSR